MLRCPCFDSYQVKKRKRKKKISKKKTPTDFILTPFTPVNAPIVSQTYTHLTLKKGTNRSTIHPQKLSLSHHKCHLPYFAKKENETPMKGNVKNKTSLPFNSFENPSQFTYTPNKYMKCRFLFLLLVWGKNFREETETHWFPLHCVTLLLLVFSLIIMTNAKTAK